MPTAEEQIAALQMQINELRAELGLEPIDIAELTGSVAELTAQVAGLMEDIEDRDKDIADEARKAMTVTGKAVFKVLDTFGAATGAVAAIATSPAPTIAAVYGAAAKITEANRAAFVAQGGTTDGAFTAAQAGDPATLDALHGFSGTMLTWSDTGRADTMTVFTDISAPTSRLFSEAYGGGGQSITSATGGRLNGAQKGVTGADFDGRTGGEVEHEPNAKAMPGDDENTVVNLLGKYKGADGSYTCTPTDTTACTSSVASNGDITFSAGDGTNGTWTFTANTGAMVSVMDANGYMTFGWWMRDDKTSADPLDNVAVFHGTQGGTAVADVGELTGKASYEGGAAGKYAWRDRVADTAHGGHFTAKAELTADFDTEMMSGSISDFQIGDDGMDPGWTVTLSAAAIDNDGAVARLAATETNRNVTWAVGGNKASAAGGWEAQLSNTGPKRNDNLPTGVSGAFDAMFGEQGRMLGAFGANITNPNPPN